MKSMIEKKKRREIGKKDKTIWSICIEYET